MQVRLIFYFFFDPSSEDHECLQQIPIRLTVELRYLTQNFKCDLNGHYRFALVHLIDFELFYKGKKKKSLGPIFWGS